MARKIVKLLIKITILIAVIALSLFYFFANFETTQKIKDPQIKGVKVNSLIRLAINTGELKEIHDAGFNTIVITPKGYLIMGKIYKLPLVSSLVGFITKKAHKEGLKVCVQPEVIILYNESKQLKKRLEKDFLLSYYQNWGQYLNKINAEYLLIPSTSIEMIPENDRNTWLIETLKETKTYYNGKIGFLLSNIFNSRSKNSCEVDLLCLKGNLVGKTAKLAIPEVKGYDFVVFELFPPIEAKNIGLFFVDLNTIDRLINRYALRTGFGEVVYAGLNLPVDPEASKSFKTLVVTEEEREVYLEKMMKFINENSSDFIIYDWDSRSLGISDKKILSILGGKKKDGAKTN
ncbi:MAG: hypothetical protein N2440_05625 [Actinobacteria bacterium]|nr:hypothetical protein [Actinomycetota bacterium]